MNQTFGSRSSSRHMLQSSDVSSICGTGPINSRINHSSINSRISCSRINIRTQSSTAGITNIATHANKPMPREMRRGVVEITPRTSRSAVVATSISVMLCNVNTIKVVATMLIGTINAACLRDQPTASKAGNNVELHFRLSIDRTSNI